MKTAKSSILFLIVIGLLFSMTTSAQTAIQTVDFETDGAGYTASPSDYYMSGSGSATSPDDYWARTNGTATEDGGEINLWSDGITFSSSQGTWFWAGEDTDNTSCTLTLDQTSISGYTNLQVKFLAAAANLNSIETIDFLKVEYSIDGGANSILVQFIGDDGSAGSSWYHEDVGGDGTIDDGGATLSQLFTEYTYNIPTTGSTLQLRFSAHNGSGEDLAFDNIRILDTTPVPVELVNFTASILEEGVVLNWQTATEVNNYGFTLERKSGEENSEWE